MHPEMMTLLEIQDLRAQLRALSGEKGQEDQTEVEQDAFNIDLDEARTHLEETIEELEDRLSDDVRERYEIIAPKRDRVVVPVIHGVCYGCFVSIPTATVGDENIHQQVRTCQNCGRFIYVAS